MHTCGSCSQEHPYLDVEENGFACLSCQKPSEGVEAEIFTDSMSAAQAIESQTSTTSKMSKRAKSLLRHHCDDARRVHQFLAASRVSICICHDKNEHNRTCANMYRNTLSCRLNRACDSAANYGALRHWGGSKDGTKNHDIRGIPQWKHGGSMVLSCDGMLIESDTKHVIIEKVGASLVRVLREQPIHGRVARAVHRGEAHAGASIAARHMLSDEEKDCYLRGMAEIHSCTMRQLYEMARKDDKEGMVARVLREAGSHRSMCPFCFSIHRFQGVQDSRNHARWECMEGRAVACRTKLKGLRSERITRAGRTYSTFSDYGHGSCVQAPLGRLAKACHNQSKASGSPLAPTDMWFANKSVEEMQSMRCVDPTLEPMEEVGGSGETKDNYRPRTRCLKPFAAQRAIVVLKRD